VKTVKIHPKRIWPGLGRTRTTLYLLPLLALSILAFYLDLPLGDIFLRGMMVLTFLNLAAALTTQPVFRKKPFLLMFHVCLMLLIALAGLGRLTYLQGRFELSQGQVFAGELLEVDQGPLHNNRLTGLRFVNQGFEVSYHEGLRRDKTENQVLWLDSSGASHTSVIGDQYPLVIDGYRIYTTFNKGFALTFTTEDENGHLTRGTVNLPSFPAREFEQAQYWTLPGTKTEVWSNLVLDEPVIDTNRGFLLTVPNKHHIVMRIDEHRYELAPGEGIDLGQGRLHYEGVRQWMGYKIFYDWTRPWMIADCLLAITFMLFHFLEKFRAAPVKRSGITEVQGTAVQA
jgi:cytochrome c biogenesis protein